MKTSVPQNQLGSKYCFDLLPKSHPHLIGLILLRIFQVFLHPIPPMIFNYYSRNTDKYQFFPADREKAAEATFIST